MYVWNLPLEKVLVGRRANLEEPENAVEAMPTESVTSPSFCIV